MLLNNSIGSTYQTDVADEEVDISRRISPALDVAAGVETVSVGGAGVRGFHLHAPAMIARVENKILAVALAPSLA
jgi:hypothetical protein